MVDENAWIELAQAEDEAFFRGDLVQSLPEGSYSAEEMWDVARDMMHSSTAIHAEMRRRFESLPGLEQVRLFDKLCASGVKTPEWWFNVLMADQDSLPDEPPDET